MPKDGKLPLDEKFSLAVWQPHPLSEINGINTFITGIVSFGVFSFSAICSIH